MNIEVLVVTSRFEYLSRCVESVLDRHGRITVIVDGYCQQSVSYLKGISETDPGLKYHVIEQKMGKSAARNFGLRKINADAVYFLDDDAFFGNDNISALEKLFLEDPSTAVIGGPNLTPHGSGYFQRISGYVFSSLIGAWKMAGRYKVTGRHFCDDKSLILCNLAVKFGYVDKVDLNFNEFLKYNEENLLLEALKKKGVKMMYEPELVVFHERRKSLSGFTNQVFGSGHGRAQMSFEMPSTLSFYHTIPSLFLLYLSALAVLAAVLPAVFTMKAGLLPFGVYLIVNFVSSVLALARGGESVAGVPLLMFCTFTAHMAYGAGFIWGALYSGFVRLEKFVSSSEQVEYEKP